MPSRPKTSNSGCKFGGPWKHPHFRPAGYKFGLGIPKDSLGFNNSLEGLAEIIESTVVKQPKEEMHRETSGMVPSSSRMCYLPGAFPCDDTPSVANGGRPPKLQGQSCH